MSLGTSLLGLTVALLGWIVAGAISMAFHSLRRQYKMLQQKRKIQFDPGGIQKNSSNLRAEELHGFYRDWLQLSEFLKGMIQHHSSTEVELKASVGFAKTTPPLDMTMTRLNSPWLFWRFLLTSFVCLVIFEIALQISGSEIILPAIFFIGALAIPVTVLTLFFEFNSPANVSVLLLARYSILGGALAVLISMIAYKIVSTLGIHSTQAAGFVEENAKLLAMIILSRKVVRERYPFILNGLVFGAAVGAGFASYETAGYIFFYFLGKPIMILGQSLALMHMSLQRAYVVLVDRALWVAPFTHVVWTAFSGALYWLLSKAKKFSGRFIGYCVALAIPILLHTAWDNLNMPILIKVLTVGAAGWFMIFMILELGHKDILNTLNTITKS